MDKRVKKKRPLNYRFIEPLEDDYQEISEYNNLVLDHEEFNDNYYVNGKRYKVKNADVIVPEENGKKISFELVFETTELPFAESIGTSLDLEKDQIKNYGRMICLFLSTNKMVHVSTRLLIFGITPFIIMAQQITTNSICIRK